MANCAGLLYQSFLVNYRMASVEWVARARSIDIRESLDKEIIASGFTIDETGSTEEQIAAISNPKVVASYWSGVRLAAYWMSRKDLLMKIEVRSDEPMLLPNTHCEQRANALMTLLPPVYSCGTN